MKCPLDQSTLTITERQGIEIDYCPTCRGVWLDRGELDKLIERSSVESPRHDDDRSERHYSERDEDEDNDHDRYDNRRHSEDGHHGKKKSSFLGDMFDF